MPGPQRLAHTVRHAGKGLAIAQLQRTLARQVALDHLHHPPGPGGHHHDAGGEKHRLVDGMGDEDAGEPGARPKLVQMQIEPVAGDLIQRAERLVHQQQGGLEGERPGDGGALLHAAR